MKVRILVKQRRNTHCGHQGYRNVHEKVRRDTNLNNEIPEFLRKRYIAGPMVDLEHWLRLIQRQELCVSSIETAQE